MIRSSTSVRRPRVEREEDQQHRTEWREREAAPVGFFDTRQRREPSGLPFLLTPRSDPICTTRGCSATRSSSGSVFEAQNCPSLVALDVRSPRAACDPGSEDTFRRLQVLLVILDTGKRWSTSELRRVGKCEYRVRGCRCSDHDYGHAKSWRGLAVGRRMSTRKPREPTTLPGKS